MAALWSAKAGAPTVLVDGIDNPGKKILISGGGRCNVLPVSVDESDFFTQGSQNVLRRWLRTWSLSQVKSFFENELGVPLKEEADGKYFPVSGKAREVLDALLGAVTSAGVTVEFGSRIEELTALLEKGPVVLATGGLSVPKTGSDGHGYEMAKELGHSTLPTYPALVPLLGPEKGLQELSGVSLPVRWRALDKNGHLLEERKRELLFTHQGFSGPAILDASHWVVRDGATLEISWYGFQKQTWLDWFQNETGKVGHLLLRELPKRLANFLLSQAETPAGLNLAQLDKARRDKLLTLLTAFPLAINGDGGFKIAEVTGGGIPLQEVDPRTLQSRCHPNLYFCGEILDVTGRLGGYNFYWAWLTGRLAGSAAGLIATKSPDPASLSDTTSPKDAAN